MPVVRNPQFYFREGFCWIDVNSTYLKSRIKGNGVFDVLSMSLFSMCHLENSYFVALINSKLISLYVDNFINNTSHFQINDARQLPIIIPSDDIKDEITHLVADIVEKKKVGDTNISGIEQRLEELIAQLYSVEL